MGKVEGLAALAFGLCVGEEGRRSPGLVSDGANPFCSPPLGPFAVVRPAAGLCAVLPSSSRSHGAVVLEA